MQILGIHKLIFSSESPADFTFFSDAGLAPVHSNNSYIWKTLNGSSIEIVKGDTSALLEVHWASTRIDGVIVDSGITHRFRSDVSLSEISDADVPTNSFTRKNRINTQIPINDSTVPCGIAHVALFSANMHDTCEKFKNFGFVISDMIDGRCIFMRSKESNPHHQLLIAQSPEKIGLQHAALGVSDVYTVITKGLHVAGQGWPTLLGPGRHVISSSTHWYFNTLLGSFELTADEDYLTHDWQPTVYDPANSTVYEWAIEGGLNPVTRRQLDAAHTTQFIDQRMAILGKQKIDNSA